MPGKATGPGPRTEGDPFARRARVARSPLRMLDRVKQQIPQRSLSTSDVGFVEWRVNNDKGKTDTEKIVRADDSTEVPPETGAKRKREEEVKNTGTTKINTDNANERTAAEIRVLIKKIADVVTDLQNTIKDNSNTHRKIKEIARKLGRYTQDLTEGHIEVWLEEKGKEREIAIPAQDKCKCTCSVTGKGSRLEHRKMVTEEMAKKIEGAKGYQQFSAIRGKWPEAVHKVAFMAKGSPLSSNKGTDIVMLVEEDEENQGKNGGIRRAFETKYEDLKAMEGKLTRLIINTATEDSTGARKENSQNIYRVELDDSEEDWYNALQEIQKNLSKEGRKKVAIYPPGNDKEGATTRRMAECIFRKTDIKCLVYARELRNEDTKRNSKNSGKKTKANPDTGVLIVEKPGMTYADLLTKVKGGIKVGSKAAQAIESIRKARDGNMLVLVNKTNQDAVEELKREIQGTGALKVKMGGKEERRKSVFIRDIDGIATKADVEEAIVREIGEGMTADEPRPWEVGELRPYYAGNKAVTVKIKEEFADTLIGRGKLRIGLNLCVVAERVDVIQCYKCWKYGHRRGECKQAEDLGERCRNCGQDGHKSVDCKMEGFCLSCKTKGHRAGAGKCPEFRKALSRARLLARKKKAY